MSSLSSTGEIGAGCAAPARYPRQMRRRLLALAVIGCGGPAARSVSVDVAVDTSAVIATVDERFLSVAVDTAELVGGVFWDPAGTAVAQPVPAYDFTRPRLRALAGELAPAYLRIGGTDA